MKRAAASLTLLAATLSGACGKAEPVTTDDAVELRPRWVIGETYEVREERLIYAGSGRFPPDGELATRSQETKQEINVYRTEVIEAADRRLRRTRRTYITSTKAGKPTPVVGKTYAITDLFTECKIESVGKNGEREPASPEERQHIRLSGLRMAGSLLPGGPVRQGQNWTPGRDLSAIAMPGRKTVQMIPILRSVKETGERRIARVECGTDIRILDGPFEQAHMVLNEILRMDLTHERILTYSSVTEYYAPPMPRRPERWSRHEADLTLTLLR